MDKSSDKPAQKKCPNPMPTSCFWEPVDENGYFMWCDTCGILETKDGQDTRIPMYTFRTGGSC